jgi:peptidoglycan hydrolase-like protein with peptidoglycan-binding domain
VTIGKGHDLKSPIFAGDEVLEACYDNERSLGKGDSGSAIEKVQRALIELGFPIPEVGANGIFGVETDLAVRSYQEARGLTVDGVIGQETMRSLDEEFITGKSEPLGPSLSEPKVSEVPSPLTPESPVKPPRGSPLGSVRAPRIPKVRAPQLPEVRAPPVPVPEVPELATKVTPRRRRAAVVSEIPERSSSAQTIERQERGELRIAGTVRGSRAFEAEAGNSVRLELSNLNANEPANIIVKTNAGEIGEVSLLPDEVAEFDFTLKGKKAPFTWKFSIETDREDSLIEWKLFSDWVKEK